MAKRAKKSAVPSKAKVKRPTQIEMLQLLNQSCAAWLLGIAARSLRDKADAPRNSDGTYNARELVRWQLTRATACDDPLLAGGHDSANLERYRAARADLAEMEAAERRGHLVDIDVFVDWWESEVARPIRRSIETLKQQVGPEAAAIVTKALDKAETSVQKRSQRHG